MATCVTPSHSSEEANITDRVCTDGEEILAKIAAMCNPGSCGTTTSSCTPTCITDTCPPTPSCNVSYAPACPPRNTCNTLCAEDNTQHIIRETKTQLYKNSAAFAVPLIGSRIKVPFDGVAEVALGAYLWARGVGILKIVGFNAARGEIELENDGSSCDGSAPGTPIASCTPFVLAMPPCGGSGVGTSTSLFPFLASSFVAPAIDNCVDISVTNVNGISVNHSISINNGIYNVSQIKSATVITICNTGAGLVPLTVVQPDDSSGNHIVPIVVIDANECSNVAVPAGSIMVCSGGVTSPLSANADGQIPVYNSETGLWEARTIGIPVVECAVMQNSVTLDPVFPVDTEYYVVVDDSSIFTVGQVVQINGLNFTVPVVFDATHIRIKPVLPLGALIVLPPGTAICDVDCCTSLDTRVTHIEDFVGSLNSPSGFFSYANIAQSVDITVDGGATPPSILIAPTFGSVPSNIATLNIENFSPIYSMGVIATHVCSWEVAMFPAVEGEWGDFLIQSYNVIDVNPAAAFLPGYVDHETHGTFYVDPAEPPRFAGARTQTLYHVVPPATTHVFRASMLFSYIAGDLGLGVGVIRLSNVISAMGIAIR